MFRIESYVTPILLSYVDKYVRDFKPADAQVSLWAGGVVLHNLVLKADVLQQEVSLPFTLVSGRIHELLIQVPWTKIMSEPIVATIDTIECVLSLHPPAPDENTTSENPSAKTTVVEAPPGYMQALVRRIVSNITLKVHHLIVKYVEDDIVLSLNVKHLSIDSCGPDWIPAFAEIDQEEPVIRRAVLLDNLTLCLDRADADGKIRYYQEPLLYRCQLNLRVLTRLVSANIRRASSLSVELRSSKLAWGVTSDQMTLLLRLHTEARNRAPKPHSPSMRNIATPSNTSIPQPVSSNTVEPTRSGSWSEWAWSWMPHWYDSAGGTDAESVAPTPTPISFTAYLDDVSLIFKVMEIEAGNRKRPRGFLEFKALHAAVKGHLCKPTLLNVKIGLRSVVIKSQDKCTCGHVDSTMNEDDPTYYVIKYEGDEDSDGWSWPDDYFDEFKVDKAEPAEEEEQDKDPTKEESTSKQTDDTSESEIASVQETQSLNISLWEKMSPLVYMEYIHERSPPSPNMNPYDNPPKDFEYSDWVEDCGLDIQLQPIKLRMCMGLIHRIDTLKKIWRESITAAEVDLIPRVLTVEEMENLMENLPQRRINIDVKQMQLCFYPWDHSLTERPIKPPALLVVDLPKGNIVMASPLYSHRVCSAASQIPEDHGTLWRGAKLHITSSFNSVGVKIASSTGPEAKPCARLDLRLVMHILLHQHYFQVNKNEHVLFSYSLKLHEGNISGSRPRLETAVQVLVSLISKTYSIPLRCSTLAKDALRDEELVALDVTLEDVTLRGYRTENVNTHVLIVHSAKGTVLQSAENQDVKQAWIFSAPDVPSGTPFIRGAAQWCPEPSAEALEYVGLWSEPIAIAIDPLFVAWLAYNPRPRPAPEQMPSFAPKTISSSLYLFKRRITPPSSSGRGGSRSASAAELVHQRARSVGTSSDKDTKTSKQDTQKGDKMLELHDRLKKTLITMDLGLVVVYVTTATASAVDCATLRLAIDRHAANSQSVLAVGLGRWSMHSSGFTKNIWQDIKHDGPTFNIGELGECFPWKITLNDVSCYSLEYNVGAEMKDKYVGGLKSTLKPTYTILPNTILELVSTTVTLSVVSKSVVFKTVVRKAGTKKNSATMVDKEEGKTRFFTGGGGNFKPTSLKEFIRGPSNRKIKGDNKTSTDDVDQLTDDSKPGEETSQKFSPGPLISIGLNIHADTPPIIIRLDQEQVHIVSAAVHCLKHIITLLKPTPGTGLRRQGSTILGSSRSLNKSFAEQEEDIQRTESSQDNKSDLVPIFQAHPEDDMFTDLHLKKFIWFQWVINRATAVISSESTKLVIEMEDLITTVDIQEHYRQLKMKMASFCVKHYEKEEGGDWNCGILGGRVLEVREPTSSKEDQFLSITITQAQISTLPASWKEELNPKMLDRKENNDSMFEIYAVIAPMEAVLEPSLLGHILTLVYETYSSTNCPMEADIELKPMMWPYCYLTAGGIRLVICTIEKQKKTDDSIVLEFSKVTLNPHPPNPISRRPITLESSWLPSEGSLEGRQYDILIEDVRVRSTQLAQLATEEKNEMDLLKKGVGVENPAHKWSHIDELATLTPILHPVNLNCIFAPPLFFGETLICGSGLEINVLSDCAVDLSVDQLELIQRNIVEFHNTIRKRENDFNDRSNTSLDVVEQTMCPYAEILALKPEQEEESDSSDDDMTISEENIKTEGNTSKSLAGDSGVETVASQYTGRSKEYDEPTTAMKKTVSVAFFEQGLDPKDYAEIFVTMGTIEITLYTADDDTPGISILRLPQQKPDFLLDEDTISIDTGQQTEQTSRASRASRASRSVTEMIRHMDIGKTKILLADINVKQPRAFKLLGNIPLLHVTLQQPNLYFWKKKVQKNFQVSLFDAWVGLGDVQSPRGWKRALMSTTRGVPDPATEVPPALATMKISMTTPGSHSSLPTKTRGSLILDVERPVMFEVCGERLKRILAIRNLVKTKLSLPQKILEIKESPPLYKLRKLMVNYSIETAILQTGQVGLSGSEGAVGWDSVSLQVAWSSRPERINMRALVGALLVGSGPPYEPRHQMMQPLQLGIEVDGQWEAWRRAEGGASCREPTLRVRFDLDRLVLELRPSDLESLSRMQSVLKEFKKCKLIPEEISEPSSITSTPDNTTESVNKIHSQNAIPSVTKGNRLSGSSIDSAESTDHFYKDDLRSGAFKIVSGGQLPMAYQVVLSGNTVSWRYPHPRTITRLVAFPLPGQNEEINCVLEVFNRLMFRWEPYTYFSIPVSEPKELIVYTPPPEALFSTMWRFRVRSPDKSQEQRVYEFRMNRFMPRQDPLMTEGHPDMGPVTTSDVTAEQLSGVLRVDSYFAPRLLSRSRIYFQMTALEIHLHNSLPILYGNPKSLEGFYVSKPLRQCHRVLTVNLRQLMGHIAVGPNCGNLYLLSTNLSSFILDCSTGTMEQLVEEFQVQSSLSDHHANMSNSRLRLRTSKMHVSLNIPRLRTLQSLVFDWKTAVYLYKLTPMEFVELTCPLEHKGKRDSVLSAIKALEGRVSLWLNNTCVTALRVGQEESDEVVPLDAGSSLAYRWRSPTAPKRIRFALATPSDWHWSSSVAFTSGSYRVRLENADLLGGQHDAPGAGVYLHVNVEETGAYRTMNISGRLVLVNMLRFELLYKVRARFVDPDTWRTISSGELAKETVCRSVLCGANTEMMLKIKLSNHQTGWSGDIPLKECPKENVPWLVKVPSEGDVSYVSVWCRVVRARADGRILATIWPLYVLYSHLPLDTDVLIVTETMNATFDLSHAHEAKPSPLVQSAPGRGYSTQLMAPGTTSAKHSLSFQYRNIECPVTREAVPLHYGVTDTSVFDKRGPVINIDEVLQDVIKWLKRSGRHAKSEWPYSIVSRHWAGQWQPALLQPRCDVTVRYRAVRAGGGCSLELHLSPIVLLCNASPIALTLRAHDAAPLCKLEPGNALSPPSAILHKPFFMSVEMGRETFVSGQLEVSAEEPGRYTEPPPGQVSLDRSTDFAIQCNQKVALFTLFYEIKEEINILGITSSFALVNRLDTDILISAIATPIDEGSVRLHPKSFKVVQPCKKHCETATPLCRFWLRSRWRGGDASQLNTFLCLALPLGAYPASPPVPVRLGKVPARKAIALIDHQKRSMPVVVTQHHHDGRTVVTIAKDPCPQFLVHNQTHEIIAVAQPIRSNDENSGSIQVVQDCEGVGWCCSVQPDSTSHYSTPAYCARHPPSAEHFPSIPFLTFALVLSAEESITAEWCQPVATAEGEHMVQLPAAGGLTIKMRAHINPHSTLIELQRIDERDISASDIRRRLLGSFTSDLSIQRKSSETLNLERTGADAKLLVNVQPQPLVQHEEVNNLGDRHIYSATSIATSQREDDRKSNEEVHPATESSSKEAKIKAEENEGSRPLDDIVVISDQITHGVMLSSHRTASSEACSLILRNNSDLEIERVRCVMDSIVIEMSVTSDTEPLVALHVDRAALLSLSQSTHTKTICSIMGLQVDNVQYESGQFDFAVVATTRAEPIPVDDWPPLYNMFLDREEFYIKETLARFLVTICLDKWCVADNRFHELTELELKVGPLALYVEDAYITALVEFFRLAVPDPPSSTTLIAEARILQRPLRLRLLHIEPIDLTLTLHTAVRIYIALDQSPLHLSSFKLRDLMTSSERLAHALTVHYLSAAILGAGWVVGGLELLGAPGALAARVGGATGGVRGIASAAAAALLRSLSAWAGSLARNLDILAGDEEHARRAAAARRRPPHSFVEGLITGMTNFAINILGAVGGLAHHPLVGVAVGETESGAAALRRGLLGAVAKPLSATADLVAYAGQGLLKQTGWDPVPQPRALGDRAELATLTAGWRRDCVRWTFRLADLNVLSGFKVLLNNAHLLLLFTDKYIVVADPESERVVEMIDLRFCSLSSYQGAIIELVVTQRRTARTVEARTADEDDEYTVSAAAMARVARYTGAEAASAAAAAGGAESRVLSLLPSPGESHSLHAALAAAIHNNADTHFSLL